MSGYLKGKLMKLNENRSSAPRSHWPHFNCLMTTRVEWLLYWAGHIQSTSINAGSFTGQPCSGPGVSNPQPLGQIWDNWMPHGDSTLDPGPEKHVTGKTGEFKKDLWWVS